MRRQLTWIVSVCLLAIAGGFFGNAAGQDAKKKKTPTPAQMKIAEAISNGHAYQKHVVDEEQFPDVKSKTDFAKLIAGVLANPTHHKELNKEREAFYDLPSNTIVIVNPRDKDRGTCFRPTAKKRYFDNLK